MSKQFLRAKGVEEIYSYGETPLTTLDKISRECKLTTEDTVFELGCGRGRSCFWLRTFIGCKVVGIEWIEDFVQLANDIKKRCHVSHVEFHAQDMTQTDFSQATSVYLYGTNLEEETIKKLISKFQTLKRGSKIITVSYPLTDYVSSSQFEIMKIFPARFTWGETDVYLQIKK